MTNYSCFIHPEDEAARKQMEAVPLFSTVCKWFMELGLEKMLHGLYMAEKIRLSPTQLPDLYFKLKAIVQRFDIDEPEFYLEMNPIPNAYTTGDKQTFVVVNSGLLDVCNEEELYAVLAHECGHIMCRHVFYRTIASFLEMALDALGVIGSLGTPLRLAMNYWSRRSEFSADRAAAAYCGSSDAMVGALLRLAGGPRRLTGNINVEEYAQQTESYLKLIQNSKWHKLLQGCAVMDRTHPFTAIRVKEIREWSQTPTCLNLHQALCEQEVKITCSKCGKRNNPKNKFCRFCGESLMQSVEI